MFTYLLTYLLTYSLTDLVCREEVVVSLSASDNISRNGYANIVLLARFSNTEVCRARGKELSDTTCLCVSPIAHRLHPLETDLLLVISSASLASFFLMTASIPAENISLLVVVGDFNLSHVDKPNHPETRRFVHLFRSVSLSQRT